MPSRLIREGFLDSDRINGLSESAQLFFVRLMLVVDDFGRFDGRPSMMRSKCYPISDGVVLDKITSMLNEVCEAGLIHKYEVDGKPYICLVQFNQRLRTKKAKYPGPEKPIEKPSDIDVVCGDGQDDIEQGGDEAVSGICQADDGQMTGMCRADDGHVTAVCQPEVESEVESEENSKKKHIPIRSNGVCVGSEDGGGGGEGVPGEWAAFKALYPASKPCSSDTFIAWCQITATVEPAALLGRLQKFVDYWQKRLGEKYPYGPDAKFIPKPERWLLGADWMRDWEEEARHLVVGKKADLVAMLPD